MAGEDSTAPKRKRPMGLKARSAKKPATVTAAGAQEVADFADETTATVMLRGDDTNEIDELEGIFDSAMEALAEGEDERALTLLRGSVHESDRLLRLHDTQGEGELEPRFYYIYGSALFSLAEASQDIEDRGVYLELALHRLEQAQEIMTEDIKGRVYMALAKVKLEMAAEAGSEDVDGVVQVLDQAVSALETNDGEATEQMLAASDLVLSLVDSQRLPTRASSRLVAWGMAQARSLLQSQPDSDECRCVLARALWLQASAMIGEDDEISDKPEFAKLLSEAVELLEKTESSDGLILRGEIEINLGNAQDDEMEMEQWYTRAVASFRRAQEMGELPEQFVQFIDDFENESDESDSE
ncbi:hypothetical protein GGH12_005444 [Coemansia sp. RSA 1822]|nr:hypothetical protein LPJ76_005573 [Coemansia sp. RSA 638]KAJ2543430.1 hypothetical protein GGF49_002035 [Coemansia sp. RSA 1853]KAJ2559332.1 hypothetical protein GGH12_005444 [Coemansia sp. RSA 1822]